MILHYSCQLLDSRARTDLSPSMQSQCRWVALIEVLITAHLTLPLFAFSWRQFLTDTSHILTHWQLSLSTHFSLVFTSLNRWAIIIVGGGSSATCAMAIGNFLWLRAHQSVCTRLLLFFSRRMFNAATIAAAWSSSSARLCLYLWMSSVYITPVYSCTLASIYQNIVREHPLAVLSMAVAPERRYHSRERERRKEADKPTQISAARQVSVKLDDCPYYYCRCCFYSGVFWFFAINKIKTVAWSVMSGGCAPFSLPCGCHTVVPPSTGWRPLGLGRMLSSAALSARLFSWPGDAAAAADAILRVFTADC